jgi:hypothetical protein
MKNQKIIFTLISLIIMLSAIASITGIFSSDGFKSFTFESIHGEETIVVKSIKVCKFPRLHIFKQLS